MRSTVNDASQSAAAGIDTRSSNSIFDSVSQTPPLRMHSAIASVVSTRPTHPRSPSRGPRIRRDRRSSAKRKNWVKEGRDDHAANSGDEGGEGNRLVRKDR